MNIELEKRQIVEELNYVSDEWVLKAIKRLLNLDNEDDVPEEHKQILADRIKKHKSGQAKIVDWDEAKGRLLGDK